MYPQNKDDHNRFRSKTIGFRVSPEEDEQINMAVSLSGLTKQDYIVAKLLDRTIKVQASCKIHRAVIDGINALIEELKKHRNDESIDDELMANITLLSSFIAELYSPEK